MRPANAIWANELGDLCFTLAGGHQVPWVFRGEWGTHRRWSNAAWQPRNAGWFAASGVMCGDLESEAEHAAK
jgi:hypothetical protein